MRRPFVFNTVLYTLSLILTAGCDPFTKDSDAITNDRLSDDSMLLVMQPECIINGIFFVTFVSLKNNDLSLLFFDFGSGEILLIVIAVFLIFGPSKIPEMARGLGKFINDIKRASEDIKQEINREADRQEREKKLAEYKAQVEKDLAVNEQAEQDGIKEKKEESTENIK
jgi:sec-independent protein translocase protein TatA